MTSVHLLQRACLPQHRHAPQAYPRLWRSCRVGLGTPSVLRMNSTGFTWSGCDLARCRALRVPFARPLAAPARARSSRRYSPGGPSRSASRALRRGLRSRCGVLSPRFPLFFSQLATRRSLFRALSVTGPSLPQPSKPFCGHLKPVARLHARRWRPIWRSVSARARICSANVSGTQEARMVRFASGRSDVDATSGPPPAWRSCSRPEVACLAGAGREAGFLSGTIKRARAANGARLVPARRFWERTQKRETPALAGASECG